MTTLLMRLTGPMQSWGTQSRFSNRDTGLEPSKSGVIGLVCSALGRSRDDAVNDLAALRMGVRVDREGVVKVDYHTAGAGYGVPDPSGGGRRTVVSRRYYLSDADFLVGLEGDPDLLAEIYEALMRPRWQLFLGRKSFAPGAPVHLPDAAPWGPGLRDGRLEEVLSDYPWLGDFDLSPRHRDAPQSLRLVVDADAETATDLRNDVPVSFAERRFVSRFVRTAYVTPNRVREEA